MTPTEISALIAEANRESTREHPERIRLLLRTMADALQVQVDNVPEDVGALIAEARELVWRSCYGHYFTKLADALEQSQAKVLVLSFTPGMWTRWHHSSSPNAATPPLAPGKRSGRLARTSVRTTPTGTVGRRTRSIRIGRATSTQR